MMTLIIPIEYYLPGADGHVDRLGGKHYMDAILTLKTIPPLKLSRQSARTSASRLSDVGSPRAFFSETNLRVTIMLHGSNLGTIGVFGQSMIGVFKIRSGDSLIHAEIFLVCMDSALMNFMRPGVTVPWTTAGMMVFLLTSGKMQTHSALGSRDRALAYLRNGLILKK